MPSQIVESFRRQAQLRVFWPPIQELQADQSDQILGAAGLRPSWPGALIEEIENF